MHLIDLSLLPCKGQDAHDEMLSACFELKPEHSKYMEPVQAVGWPTAGFRW